MHLKNMCILNLLIKVVARTFKGHTYSIYIKISSGGLEHKWQASLPI